MESFREEIGQPFAKGREDVRIKLELTVFAFLLVVSAVPAHAQQKASTFQDSRVQTRASCPILGSRMPI